MTSLLCILALGLSTAEPAADSTDAAAYCAYVQHSAEAAAAPLLWPQLIGSAAVANAFEVAGSAPLQLRGRFMAGVDVSTTAILRGLTLQEQALADCRRYRLSSHLRSLVERAQEGLSRHALAAKLQVLRDSLPVAERALDRQQGQLALDQTTLAALRDAELRLDGLRADINQTRQAMESSADDVQLTASIDALLQARLEADAEVEAHAARLRQFSSWDLTLRGGYDRITDTQEQWPIFARVVLSASLGIPAQRIADEAAATARDTWLRQETGGLQERVEHVRRTLQANLRADENRLHDLQALMGTLQHHLETAQHAPGAEARALADALEFDLLKARAEHAFSAAHSAELRALLEAP